MMMDVHFRLYVYRNTYICIFRYLYIYIYSFLFTGIHIPFTSFYLDTVGCSRSCVHYKFNLTTRDIGISDVILEEIPMLNALQQWMPEPLKSTGCILLLMAG